MARVIKLAVALVALVFVGAYACQEAKIAKLAPLIGEWDVKMEIKEPAEIAGIYNGSARFSWDPNKQHIRAEGSLSTDESKTTYGTGFLSFDDNAAEADQAYRAAFLWADDGRILTMKGNFQGKVLVFDASPQSADGNKDLKFKVTTALGKDKITVQVDLPVEPKSLRLLELTLTRKK
jgi:hypothetical protein